MLKIPKKGLGFIFKFSKVVLKKDQDHHFHSCFWFKCDMF